MHCLKNFYQNIVDEIAKEQTFFNTSKIEYNFWVQMYNNKAHHDLHTHFGINNNVIISWVHFLKVPETKCFRFTDTKGNTFVPDEQSTGDLICFPSWSWHEVIPNKTNHRRLIISGNISVIHYD